MKLSRLWRARQALPRPHTSASVFRRCLDLESAAENANDARALLFSPIIKRSFVVVGGVSGARSGLGGGGIEEKEEKSVVRLVIGLVIQRCGEHVLVQLPPPPPADVTATTTPVDRKGEGEMVQARVHVVKDKEERRQPKLENFKNLVLCSQAVSKFCIFLLCKYMAAS